MDEQVREDARRRRAPLREAACDLELAVSAPVGTGKVWRDRVRDGLNHILVALDQHVRDTEGPEGLYQELQTEAPRLSNLVRLLGKEHDVIEDDVRSTIAFLSELNDVLEEDDAEPAREAVLQVLGKISRHRAKGADLIWRAYSVDIGGE